jgi:hypothetical protein
VEVKGSTSWANFVIFKKNPIENNCPNGRKFTQSGQPAHKQQFTSEFAACTQQQ